MTAGARLRGVRAVVFDTDGVLVDSAGIHAAAWKLAFDACLEEAGASPPFDEDADYRRYVDGKSRRDGTAGFLEARGLRLPEGDPDDPPGTGTVWAVAARKEELFVQRLGAHGAGSWPGTVRLLRALREADTPCAAASASRHAGDLLRQAGLLELFDTVVDGNAVARLRLPGKPDPALFLEAAGRLGRPASQCAVVEDAVAGVEAGRRGGFGMVVGVNRTGGREHAEDLLAHGADVVVSDLEDLLDPPAGG